MPLIAYVGANPVISPMIFLGGVSVALCGYLGHTRPLGSGFKALCLFLFILLVFSLLRFGLGTGRADDFISAFLAPLTTLFSLVGPGVFLWLHLRRANQKMTAARIISKWLRPLVFISGLLLAFISLPGLFKYLAWFI